MGANESKLSFLMYEDAVKRITEDELKHLRETFKVYSGNGNILSKSAFFSDLLSELFPSQLAEHFYIKCGGGSKGIGFRETVVLLILITNGTLDEKVRFLFHLLSEDGNVVTQKDLKDLYLLCDDSLYIAPKCISDAFRKKESLNYDDFFGWIIGNSSFCTITLWLLEEQFSDHAIKLSNSLSTESFYSTLVSLTKFTEQDIIDLEKRYWSLKAVSPTGKYDLQTLKIHVRPLLPEHFVDGFFRFFDKNNDGHVDLKELVCGISLCCRGTNTERLRVCFEIFDIDQDGYLSKNDLLNMLSGFYEISQQYSTNVDTEFQQQFMDNFNLKEGEKLSLDEFQHWGYSNSLVYEFLLLLSQICHVIFGLCPLYKREEGNIVRRWIERESIRGLQFGSLYYIISITWWKAWKKHVNFDIDGLSPVQLIHKKNTDNSDSIDEVIDTPVSNGSINNISSDTVLTGDQNHFAVDNETSLKSHMTHMLNRNSSPVSPGPIENGHLIEPGDSKKVMILTGEGGKLKEDTILIYGKDYQVVPEQIWKALSLWYGADVALPRTVIVEVGQSAPKLELYPIQIDLYRHTPPPKSAGFNMGSLGINNFMSQIYNNIFSNTHSNSTTEQPILTPPKRTLQYRACFSRKNTVRQIIDFLSQQLKIEVDDLRLWVMEEDEETMLLEEEEKELGDICSNHQGKFLIEVRNCDLSWPEEMRSLVATRNFRERSNTGPLEKGATGLHNLGNTCFMNSAIQCLSNTRPLTQYFSKKLYEFELNKSNPLGMKGVLAKRYGDVVLDLWSGIYRSIAPVKLRCTLGRYAPRFNGFQQHDSQEFLSFLLDGLHEDLNRVHEKPYVELKDSDGRSDYLVAKEAWDNHVKRNKSIIVDLFQGQLKSQVRCLYCSHCSVTFDPFTFLSLPLPMESSIHLEIPVFLQGGEQAKKYGILLEKSSTTKTLKCKLSLLCGVSVDKLLLAEINGPIIVKFLPDKFKIHQNLVGYIFAYELGHDVSEFLASKYFGQFGTKSNSTDTLDKQENGSPSKSNRVVTPERKMKSSSEMLNQTYCSSNNTSSTRINDVTITNLDTFNTLSLSECLLNIEHGFIIAMHRKMVQSNYYFLSWQKFRSTLFGVPIVLSFHSRLTNRELYAMLWQHVSKYLTGVTLRDNEGKYPFVVKSVNKDGNYCSSCMWYKFCRGCEIECNDSLFDLVCTHIAIDWNTTTLHLHYQTAQERNFSEDTSIQESLKMLREPITLDQCLKDFTKEEELGEDEMWYCSKCKEHRTIAKKLDIWKLPPVFVIHLKRFLSINNRWVKSHKLVQFPMKLFDPSMYLAEGQLNKNKNEINLSSSGNSLCTSIDSSDILSNSAETSVPTDCHGSESDVPISETVPMGNANEHGYSLYAISCHSGMLNGGHYITFAKNPNKKWYCYNDSSCKEVYVDLIEKESPYMLFFEKRSLNWDEYMPDVKSKEVVDIQMEEEEVDKEDKKYCSVM